MSYFCRTSDFGGGQIKKEIPRVVETLGIFHGGHILVKFELRKDSISCRVRGMLCYLVSSIIGDDRRPSSFRR